MNVSRARMISVFGMALGLVLILAAIAKSVQSMSDHYAPLLFLGLVFGIISTPFYYYYKSADRTEDEAADAGMAALNAAGKNIEKERTLQRQQQRERIQKNNS